MFIDQREIYKDHCKSFFLCLLGDTQDKESVKEKWDFETCWNWCKMKILMMLSPSVQIAYLEIFQFSGDLRKTN